MNDTTVKQKRAYMIDIGFFFDGFDGGGIDAIYQGNKDSLGVSKIGIDLDGDVTTVTFTLKRPGLLIGKAGRTIDSLEKYLSSQNAPVKVLIIELDPWKSN